ncbi:MAG: dienelactone hydrolase [Myxococcales bacterium]|nr:MAG: dienelactone hydrolase [Myxococcales bacterium]
MSMLEGFTESSFNHDGVERTLYRRGHGPGIIVMHEIPGITPQVAHFGRRIADAGFSVVMPDLFGTPGKPLSVPYIAGQLARACISREFHVLASHASSPITDWLRALCRQIHSEIGGRGVGAIGMCLTGNFALALAMDPCLMAPVLSQPSLPFPMGPERRAALHLSSSGLACLKRRVREDQVRVLGLRFNGDPMCPPERFETLRRELGNAFEGIEIDAAHANPDAAKPAHSVVTTHLIDEEGQPTRAALNRVIAFFGEQLRPGG